jgi:DNA repair ATPase RecN
MKQSANNLTSSIFKITNKMDSDFPELLKYINELPEQLTSQKKKDINCSDLEDYLDSLKQLMTQYAQQHLNKK